MECSGPVVVQRHARMLPGGAEEHGVAVVAGGQRVGGQAGAELPEGGGSHRPGPGQLDAAGLGDGLQQLDRSGHHPRLPTPSPGSTAIRRRVTCAPIRSFPRPARHARIASAVVRATSSRPRSPRIGSRRSTHSRMPLRDGRGIWCGRGRCRTPAARAGYDATRSSVVGPASPASMSASTPISRCAPRARNCSRCSSRQPRKVRPGWLTSSRFTPRAPGRVQGHHGLVHGEVARGQHHAGPGGLVEDV